MDQIKAAFEFRAAVNSGFLPLLDGCGSCGDDPADDLIVFDIMNGMMKCGKCVNTVKREEMDPDRTAEIYLKINRTVLSALRYIAEAPLTKFLSFSIPEEDLTILSHFSETYLLSHLEHSFSSLKYYKDLKLYGMKYE